MGVEPSPVESLGGVSAEGGGVAVADAVEEVDVGVVPPLPAEPLSPAEVGAGAAFELEGDGSSLRSLFSCCVILIMMVVSL